MRLIVLGLIIVAIFIAGLAVVLVTNYLDQERDDIKKMMEAKDKVLVAGVDLGIGTTVVRDNVRWQPWPKEGLAPDYVVEVEGRDVISKYLGSVIRHPIAAGEPITASRLVKRDAPGFLSAILAPGKRAVVVQVSITTGTGGFILPGDYVDVLLTHSAYAKEYNKTVGAAGIAAASADLPPAMALTTETILTNVRVLAVDTVVGKVESTARAAKTVTLEVTPKEMQLVYTAARVGTLSLALRSLRPGADVDESQLMINTTDIETSPLLQRLLRFEQEQEEQRMANVGLDAVLFGRQLPTATVPTPPPTDVTPPVTVVPPPDAPDTPPDVGALDKPIIRPENGGLPLPLPVPRPQLLSPETEVEGPADVAVEHEIEQTERPSIKIYQGGVNQIEEWRPQ